MKVMSAIRTCLVVERIVVRSFPPPYYYMRGPLPRPIIKGKGRLTDYSCTSAVGEWNGAGIVDNKDSAVECLVTGPRGHACPRQSSHLMSACCMDRSA